MSSVSVGEKCPECGSANIICDYNMGETVCGDCGFVVSELQLSPPPERKPRLESRSYYGVTSFAVGTERFSSLQRTELNIAKDIDRLVTRLMLPDSIKPIAHTRARKLLRRMREQQGDEKTRLNGKEIVIVSTWNAMKVTGNLRSIDEYVARVNEVFPRRDSEGNPKPYTAGDILKLLNRANSFAGISAKVPDPADYINRLEAKLTDAANCAYLSSVRGYAMRMIRKNPWVAENRKPTLVAAAALLAADELLGRKIGVKRIAEAAGAGTTSITSLATDFKRHAPAAPRECASLRYERLIGGGMFR